MLQEIKDEVARRHNIKNWKVVLMYLMNGSSLVTIEIFDSMLYEVINKREEYLRKEIKELREKLSDSKA